LPVAPVRRDQHGSGEADQWHLIETWTRLALAIGRPGAEDMWWHMSWALMRRADRLAVPFPVADDASELGSFPLL